MNNKPYWLQESGTDAIWYDKNFQNWKIGHESNLGSGSGARMLSYRGTGATALPQEATPWQYLKDGNWTPSSDIIIYNLINVGSKVEANVEKGKNKLILISGLR